MPFPFARQLGSASGIQLNTLDGGIARRPATRVDPPTALFALPNPAALPTGATLQVLGGVWSVETASGWVGLAHLSASVSLPSPASLPNGALLQVIAGVWNVESIGGVWVATTSLPAAGALPSAAGHPDGSTLQVVDGKWTILE